VEGGEGVNTCRSCKWWKTTDAQKPLESLQACASPKITECGGGTEPTNDMLMYSYFEGGTFFTGPDFGCVHHEQNGEPGG
jgi:hypothetical protein